MESQLSSSPTSFDISPVQSRTSRAFDHGAAGWIASTQSSPSSTCSTQKWPPRSSSEGITTTASSEINHRRPFARTAASETCRRSPSCRPSLSSPSPPIPTVPSIPLRHASIATGTSRASSDNPYRVESCENSQTLLHCLARSPSNITSLATDSDPDLSSAIRLPRHLEGSPSFSLKQSLSKPLLLGRSSRGNDRNQTSSQEVLVKPHASLSPRVRPSCSSDRDGLEHNLPTLSSSACVSPTTTFFKIVRYTDTRRRSDTVPLDVHVCEMDKYSRLDDNPSSTRQAIAVPNDAVGKGDHKDGKNKGTPQRNVLKRRQSATSRSKHASVQSSSTPSPGLFSRIGFSHSKPLSSQVETLDSLPRKSLPSRERQDVFGPSRHSSPESAESRNQVSDSYSPTKVVSEDPNSVFDGLHKQTRKSRSSAVQTRESRRIPTDQLSPTGMHGDIERLDHSALRSPSSGQQLFGPENGNTSQGLNTHLGLPKSRHSDNHPKISEDVRADGERVALPYYTVFGSTSQQIPAGDSRDSYGASFGMLTETYWTTKTTITASNSRTEQEEKPALGRTLVRKLSGKFRRTEGGHDAERGRQTSRFSYVTPSTRHRSAEDISHDIAMPSPAKEDSKMTLTSSKDKTRGLWRRISRSQSRSRDHSNDQTQVLPPLPAFPNHYRVSDTPLHSKHSSKNDEYMLLHSRSPRGLKKDKLREVPRQSFLDGTSVDFVASSPGYSVSTPSSPPITTPSSFSSDGNLVEFRNPRSRPSTASYQNSVEPVPSLRQDIPSAKDLKRRRAKSLASRTVYESTDVFRRISSNPGNHKKSENVTSSPITFSQTPNALHLDTKVKEPLQGRTISNPPPGNSPPPRPQRSDKRPKPLSSRVDHFDEDSMYPPVMQANRAVARLTFRKLDNETRAALSEKEKAEKWAALLKESDAAGGTLRLGGSDDKLPSDELRFSKTLSELALEI